jgi:hypothetical protein
LVLNLQEYKQVLHKHKHKHRQQEGQELELVYEAAAGAAGCGAIFTNLSVSNVYRVSNGMWISGRK